MRRDLTETAPLPRPKVLLVVDRPPGIDSGYSMRVDNVIAGLRDVGDLHVCMIDSTTGGIALPMDAGFSTSVIRAQNPSRRLKVVIAIVALAQLPYRRAARVRAALSTEFEAEPWDLVWFSRIRSYSISRGLPHCPILVDFDDLTDQLISSLISDRIERRGVIRAAPRTILGVIERRRWTRRQQQIAREVDRVTVCSDEDRAHLGATNCTVVRNGVRIPRSTRRLPDDSDPMFLFVGSLEYEPNRLAVEWMAFEVLPLIRRRHPTASLVVVGHDNTVSDGLRNAPGVTLVGYARDLDGYYARTTVAVAPLHSGGGTRLKVIEAMARSVPLVSTSLGCYGLGLTHDQELLIADSPEDFAAACVAIFESRELADRLARAGEARYVEHHTAEVAIRDVARAAMATMRSPGSTSNEHP
jgi:glycosyltransferase involved in cell wall biosynthesis